MIEMFAAVPVTAMEDEDGAGEPPARAAVTAGAKRRTTKAKAAPADGEASSNGTEE